jgi:hypothetical protein
MKLLTKSIQNQAEKQFDLGSDFDSQKVVAKFFDPCGSWSWFLVNKDPQDSYCYGIVKGFEIEAGSFDIYDLINHRGRLGIGIERDLSFTPRPASQVFEKLLNGEHV